MSLGNAPRYRHLPSVFAADNRPASLSSAELDKTFGAATIASQKPAKSFQWGGELWNRFQADLKENNGFEEDYGNHLEARFELKYDVQQWLRVVLGFEADYYAYGNENHWEHDGEIRPYHAYLNFSWPALNIRLGNQIVRWGKADEVSPLDNVNPEDLRDGFVRPRTGRKIPIPMLNIEIPFDGYNIQIVYLPMFEPAKLNLRGTDWAFFDHAGATAGTFTIDRNEPELALPNGEIGARFAGKIAAFDYAFSYLYTWEDLPSLGTLMTPPGFVLPLPHPTQSDLAQFAQVSRQPIRLNHHRQHIAGLEWETVFGSFGFRGDIAYINERHYFTRSLQSVSKPVVQGIVGVDYTGVEDFYANFQFSQTIILDYSDSILFFEHLTHEINGRLSQQLFDEHIELIFRYFYNITQSAYYINPKVLWKYWQNIEFELGVDVIDGPRDTLVGYFRNNDQVYAAVRWFF